MPKILISVEDQEYRAELSGGPTAEKLYDVLPIEGEANTWGEEIYFEVPLSAPQEPDAPEEVAVG